MALSKSPYRGTRDFFPQDMRLRNFIFSKMSEVSELFAYEPYDGPLLEEVDLYLAKSGEELINEQIYSFTDRGDRHVAIRPELTPTLARMVAQIHREVAKPLRWYSIPNLMRYEKPQKGRLREFYQYNADIFGAGAHGEMEILQMAVALLKSFGATHEQFEVLVNDRRVVDSVFKDVLKLSNEQSAKLYKVVDKVHKVNEEALKKMTSEIINDVSVADIFYSYLKLKSYKELNSFLESHGVTTFGTELTVFGERLHSNGLDPYVKYDPTIVRGLDYYTSVVFEIFDKHPDNRRAIAGGGAYANLLQIFNEPALEGVGIGLGEVPLTEFLKAHNLMPNFSKAQVDVLVAYTTALGETMSQQVANLLRSHGVKVESTFGEAKVKKVYTQSERKNYNAIIFIGEDEVTKSEVQVKNLKTQQTANFPLFQTENIIKAIKGNA